jgi:TctA family transporter
MSTVRTSAVLGRRACALVAVASATVHGLMLGHAGNPVVAVLVVAMMAACLYCARELWTAGPPRAWCVVAVMNLGMVAVHWSLPSHHHGAAVTTISTAVSIPTPTLMTVATTVSLAEAAVATVVLWVQTRRRAISLAPQWN